MLLCFIYTSVYLGLTRHDKALKSVVSGDSQAKSMYLQQPLRQWRTNKDSQDGVSLQEQQQGQGEAHTELPGQALISLNYANRPKSRFCLSAFIAELLRLPPSPQHMPFILCILFILPLCFTCCWLPRLLSDSAIALSFFCKQKEKKPISIYLVVLTIISELRCYTHTHTHPAACSTTIYTLKLLPMGYCTFSCVCKHLY